MRHYLRKLLLALAVLIVLFSICYRIGNGAQKKEPEMTTHTQEPAVLEIPDLTPPEYDTDTVEALAKMV